MNVKECVLAAQTNKNSISVVYDALIGAYLLTQPDTMIDWTDYNNIVSFLQNSSQALSTLPDRLTRYSIPLNSGRALFSALLPEDLYYRKGNVFIKDGVLLSGIITKEHLGSTNGSIIQVLMKDYEPQVTFDFITDVYYMMGRFLDIRGFSVGLDDCYLQGKDPEKSIAYEVERAKMLVRSMGWKLDDPLEEERRERQIIAYLNTAKGLGARISRENLSESNAFNIMAKSGGKGSEINIAQITGILGQQFVKGQRMPETLSGGRRCLPYFAEDSIEPEARGFCVNSFLTGLTPAELFFAQAGGREGLMDTAIKTQDTGHLHHKMEKALEDVKVYHDGSVRNAFGMIFQYTYADDGFDAARLETVSTKSGRFTSFINIKRLVGRLNNKYGYASPSEPEVEVPVPVGDTFSSSIQWGEKVPILPVPELKL